MSSLLFTVQQVIGAAIDIALESLRGLGAFGSLFVVSAVAGALLVLVYGKVSFQSAIRSVKRQIAAALLEVALFRHTPSVCVAAQGRLLLGGVRYLLLAVPPLVILAAPVMVLMSHLNLWYGYRGVYPNEAWIVEAEFADPALLMNSVLEGDSSIEIVGPVRDLRAQRASWRIKLRATDPGQIAVPLRLKSAERVIEELPLVRGERIARIEPTRSQGWTGVLYPSRAPLPASLRSLAFGYQARDIGCRGVRCSWVVWFFGISLLSGLLLSRVCKIEV